MTDTLDRDHIDAGLNLLRADAGLTVYPDPEGNIPAVGSRADHYVLVYPQVDLPPDGAANALTGASATWVVWWYCHNVGPTLYSATAVAMRVRVLLLDRVPTITGRVCGPIRRVDGQPADKDDSTGLTVYDRVDVYRMQTAPG